MISFLKFTICSSVVCEDWRVLTELVPVSFFEGGAERVAVVGAILSSQVRLSLNVVIWPSLETVILDLLVDPVTVLETVVSLSTEMVLVSVWDTDASEGGTTNWRVTDFNRRSDVGCGCADRSGGWRGFAGKSNHLSRVSTWQRSCFDFAVGGGGATTSAEGADCTALVEMQADSLEVYFALIISKRLNNNIEGTN